MHPQQFDDLVRKAIVKHSGKQLPDNHKNAEYNLFLTREDKKGKKLLLRTYSSLHEFGIDLEWGIEIISPIPPTISLATPNYFFQDVEQRAFIALQNQSFPCTDTFKLLSENLEHVTRVPINQKAHYLEKREYRMPEVNGKTLEKATEIILRRFYRGK
ncbi:hypothetical protein HOD75_01060 [archaeon]|jgi:hypothetical protein|nr:hypothetical protein [Candidatus Woesearchaeota archaeon]MBT4135936.1 hypothetical protein [archaeon]MBT4241467.1 hypothetical protein [archaeon]MBT4417662.1 hypothetical protein [archaeon]